MATETPLDRFKAVLGGAARALADEPEIELAYTADAPTQSGKHIKVPMPARGLPPEQVAEARGFADGFALRLKHHDTALHLKGAPQEAVARRHEGLEHALVHEQEAWARGRGRARGPARPANGRSNGLGMS